MGKPDNESLDFSQRLKGIDQIFEVTTKPLIMDGDTGGKIEHFDMKIKSAERLGISALIIEDKKGLKKNKKAQILDNKLGIIDLITKNLNHNDYLMIKGSNSTGLNNISKKLKLGNIQSSRDLTFVSDTANAKLYEEYFHLTNIEKDFLPVFKRFYSNKKLRTCPKTGEVMDVDERFI